MKPKKTDTTAPASETKVTCLIELSSNTYRKLLIVSVGNAKSINETVRFLIDDHCKNL